jgi:hypothetical protein
MLRIGSDAGWVPNLNPTQCIVAEGSLARKDSTPAKWFGNQANTGGLSMTRDNQKHLRLVLFLKAPYHSRSRRPVAAMIA